MRLVNCFWVVLITALSLAPFGVKLQLNTMGPLHDAGHLGVFLLTAVLLCWTAKGTTGQLARYLGVCLIAVSIEALEAAIYHNRFEWRDVMIDVLGAAIGLVVIKLIPISVAEVERGEVPAER